MKANHALNLILKKNLNFFAVDWSKKSKSLVILLYSPDSPKKYRRIKHDGDFLSFLKSEIARHSFVLVESTFESFLGRGEVKKMCIDASKDNDILLYTISPRETAHWRKNNNIVKSDINDAVCIMQMLLKSNKEFRQAGFYQGKSYDAGKEAIKILRYNEWDGHEEYLKLLPPASLVPEQYRIVLTKNKKKFRYNIPTVVPWIIAAKEIAETKGNRDNFEAFLGSFGHGYPGIPRSNFYRNTCLSVEKELAGSNLKRDLESGEKPRTEFEAKSGKKFYDMSERIYHKKSMNLSRRASRWVYHFVKNYIEFGEQAFDCLKQSEPLPSVVGHLPTRLSQGITEPATEKLELTC